MSEKIKTYFYIAVIVAVLAAGFSATSMASTYSDSIGPGMSPSFNVTGEGKVVAVPDVAEVSFQVITEGGEDLAALQEENTRRVNKVLDFVKGKGVESKDISTESYSVSPRYASAPCPTTPYGVSRDCGPAEIVGYTVSQSVRIKIRDLDEAGAILSGLVNNGANSVSGLYFTVDDRQALEAEARGLAIRDAKEKAKLVAKEGGFDVGRILLISEYTVGPYFHDKAMSIDGRGGAMEAAVAPAPAIEPGSQEIIVNVSVQYEIED